ncbi:glycosyltransferase [Myroides odoratimimus]|uniref:glycosyltransferase n=1 Tax=Myroides odoratimimus TaxID=76832 RepID=UPI00257607D8|nr:glycosyltransferase [Myroides odoratimimus]MDM1496784.1 glycosyltransferase [Myroides odoratimimus]MDM1530440.1 glycosyltransferase [Myroides odoratimimus]
MSKRLLVICEPNFDPFSKCTKNLAMNEILYNYQNFFEEVHCVVPGQKTKIGIEGVNNIIYHTVEGYTGNRVNKFLYQFRNPRLSIKEIVNNYGITHIQLRVPSTFSLAFYSQIKKINSIVLTTYIAGDVYENLVLNFNRVPMIKGVARFMEKRQEVLLCNSLVVTTGDVLKQKYEIRNKNIHAFYSTTHNDVKYGNNSYINDKLSLVFVGRIDLAKRLDVIVDVVKILKDKNIFVNVNIVGDGPQLSNIKNRVESLGITNQFVFYGYVTDRGLIDKVLLKSTIFILSSVTEGTAKVLPEAMSRGVIPIGIKNVGSNNYIIDDKVNGFLVSKGNESLEISNIVEKLLLDRSIIEKMQGRAYEYAQSKTAKIEISRMWEFIFKNSK